MPLSTPHVNDEDQIDELPSATISSKGKSLFANATWTLIGNVTFAACQAIWLVLLAHLVPLQSSSDFFLGLAIAAPIQAFSGLALRNVLATDTTGEFNFTEYMTLRLFMTGLSLLIIVMIPAVGFMLGMIGFSSVVVIGAVGLAKSIESISDIIFGKFQNHERLDLIGLSMTLKGLFSLLGLGIGAVTTHSALGAALGLACSWMAVLIVFDLPRLFSLSGLAMPRTGVRSYISTFQDRTRAHNRLVPRMWQLGKRSAPLAFANGIYMLNPNIVMYFARAAVGEVLFAVFATLQQLASPGSYIMNAIGMAITPRLARAYSNGRYAEFRNLLLKAILGVSLMGALGIAFVLVAGKWFLSVFFKPVFADYNGILVWLLVAATISYVTGLLGFGSIATRTFRRFTIPYLLVSLVAIVASAVLVPRWGMFGAAMAFAVIHVAAAVSSLLIIYWAGLWQRTPPPDLGA